MTVDKRDLERLIAEVNWLKKRLQRVEDAIRAACCRNRHPTDKVGDTQAPRMAAAPQ